MSIMFESFKVNILVIGNQTSIKFNYFLYILQI